MTFATLCLVMIAVAVLTLRHQTPANQVAEATQPADEQRSFSDLVDRHREVIKPSIPNRAVLPVVVKRVRHHKPVNELALAMKLSTWRSPTASLLKTNEDDNKLMSLPKLGESLKTLRSYTADDLN